MVGTVPVPYRILWIPTVPYLPRYRYSMVPRYGTQYLTVPPKYGRYLPRYLPTYLPTYLSTYLPTGTYLTNRILPYLAEPLGECHHVEPPRSGGGVGGPRWSPLRPGFVETAGLVLVHYHGGQHLPCSAAAEHQAVADLAGVHHLQIELDRYLGTVPRYLPTVPN